jgi:hypothetical protein
MTWFPLGPDFVNAPRDLVPADRLSRRNEAARQTMVSSLTVGGSNIYTVENPYPTGSGVWRTGDLGQSWTPISDALSIADPSLVPICIAVDPVDSQYVYLGTESGDVHVASQHGDSWISVANPGGVAVARLLVDPRNAGDPATATVYAGTQNGLYRAVGGVWSTTPLVSGSITAIAAYVPTTGTPHFFVGVAQVGVYHTTDPTATWTLLSTGAAGMLPAHTTGSFDRVLIDYCALTPGRVYVWLANSGQSVALWRTDSFSSGWTQVASPTLPSPGQGFYSYAFAVTPSSPGTGNTDVLVFASVKLFRSIDSGQTWQQVVDNGHDDSHAFGFIPTSGLPLVLVGNDGGLVAYTRLADPTFDVTVYPTNFDDRTAYDSSSAVVQNLNHGKRAAAVQRYHADPSVAAIGYAGCQDTGIIGGSGTLGWRGINGLNGDGRGVACAAGSNGMKVWFTLGSPFFLDLLTDDGSLAPSYVNTLFDGAPGAYLVSTSNHILDVNKNCVLGAQSNAGLTLPITTTGLVTVTPSSMVHIEPGILILIGSEVVTVAASPPPTATTFSANVLNTYAAGSTFLRIYNSFVVRIDQNGTATQISQELGNPLIFAIAGSATDPNSFVCATDDPTGHRVWVTPGGMLGPTSIWNEPTTNRPVGNGSAGLQVSSLAIDGAGNIYALLTNLDATVSGMPITTPLFQIAGGSWTPLPPASALPTADFGPLVADPVQPNTLYAASGSRVYRVQQTGGQWSWTEVGTGLPGQTILDLWIGNISTSANPKVLLRASAASRGVYEHDVTQNATDPPPRPYLRNNFLDQGWLSPVPDSLVNPFSPAGGVTVFHYQSADVKLDARQLGPFYQTDPEGASPLSHVPFDELYDNSQSLPDSDLANVHVQIHNRSFTTVDNVNVWAIFARPSGGVPSLAATSMGPPFDFWSQFPATGPMAGQIVPNLPPTSPWQSVGPVQTVSGIDAAHPQVVSWLNWQIPALATGDHYCMVVFVHGPGHLINESGTSVDAIVRTNPQIAQKNLHIGPHL